MSAGETRPQRGSTATMGVKTRTRSSPLVDSASSSGSPGAWMVTDLSPRLLPSRLLARCLSRRSLREKTSFGSVKTDRRTETE